MYGSWVLKRWLSSCCLASSLLPKYLAFMAELAEKNTALSLPLRMVSGIKPSSASSYSRRSEIRISVGILISDRREYELAEEGFIQPAHTRAGRKSESQWGSWLQSLPWTHKSAGADPPPHRRFSGQSRSDTSGSGQSCLSDGSQRQKPYCPT